MIEENPAWAALDRGLDNPDIKADELWELALAQTLEYGEKLVDRGLDGAGFVEIYGALLHGEISSEDFTALLDSIDAGTFEPAMIERRKLLALARRALEAAR